MMMDGPNDVVWARYVFFISFIHFTNVIYFYIGLILLCDHLNTQPHHDHDHVTRVRHHDTTTAK